MNTTTHQALGSDALPMRDAAARASDFAVPVPTDERRGLARAWLWLGLLALIGSGVFSILLVLARTPGVNRLLPGADFFRIALVVHVDLSVLVWFVSVAGLLWSVQGARRSLGWGWSALALSGAGTLLMALAAFIAPGEAIMANYIPMLDGPVPRCWCCAPCSVRPGSVSRSTGRPRCASASTLQQWLPRWR